MEYVEARLYRQIVESMAKGVFLIRASDGVIVYANPAIEELFGYMAGELNGKHISAVNAPTEKTPEEIAAEIISSLNMTGKWRGEVQNIKKDGTIFHCYANVSIFEHPKHGKVWVSIHQDVTEQKHIEGYLRQAESKYRDIFENAIEGIFQSSPGGYFINVNVAMARIFGYDSPEDMITSVGNKIADRIYADSSQRAEFVRVLGQHDSVQEFEAQNRRKDGSIIWTRTSARTIRDEDGQVLYYEGFLEDITKRKIAEESLRKAKEELQTQLSEIQSLHESLRDQATRDALTGLYNRRYLHETMERELSRAKREHLPISVMMIDIDYFKDFNDAHGHQAGDEVLLSIGRLLRDGIRQGDIACRYGGEEFIVIMPGAFEGDAKRRAETIRADFNATPIHCGNKNLFASISVGIAFYPQHGSDMKQLIESADIALYGAKQSGKNRVYICGQ